MLFITSSPVSYEGLPGVFFDLAANVEANELAVISDAKAGVMRRKCPNQPKLPRM
nr:MAG TPA: hypothetical protein [Bacteriophage sp.]DAX74678.1 MAG TPA: hypothetical protein [Caudoviricetes sp.]